MRRRSRAGGEPVKTRRRKTVTLKRRNAPKAVRNRSVSVPSQETEVARLTRERDEALLRETANSEILGLISKSPGDLKLVFRTILEDATRICNATFGILYRFKGKAFHFAAEVGTPAEHVEFQKQRGPFQPLPGGHLERVMRTKQVSHSADRAAEPVNLAARLGDVRSLVAVPMLKDDALIGAILIYRQEVRPFTDKQIALLQNFAAQAVIAIENTRLLNELRQRTADLTESLDQQTATSQVLQVISSSPGDLEPVFASMLENAVRICDAKFGNIYRWEGDALHLVASHNTPPAFVQARRRSPFHRAAASEPVISRLLATKAAVHVADAAAQPGYIDRSDYGAVLAVELGGVRTALAVPMLQENELIGSFTVYRQEVRPFTDKQIALVTNFAAQAVIAIENTRLLNELRQSLDQQTATSEVLRVISSSPGELKPVFQSMLENAVRVCGATFGSMLLREGDEYRRVARHNAPQKFEEFSNKEPTLRRGMAPSVDRVIDTGQASHILDVAVEDPNEPIAKFAGARTFLVVPMLKDNEAIGVLGIYRQEVRPFTDKQIELVQNFAAQAVIAIENTRLLNELRQSLEQQTATSEVLGVISSSPGELNPVFDAMLENAIRICDAKFGHMLLFDGEAFMVAAMKDTPRGFANYLVSEPKVRPYPGSYLARLVEARKTVHVPDAKADTPYLDGQPRAVAAVDLGGIRTQLFVPMIKEGDLVGSINIYRQEVRPFTDKQIALVQNFAAQAVIAIENTRLLNELRQRTDDLTESLEQQTATSEVLKVISSSPGDLQPVFEAMLENATRICEAKFGTLFRFDGEAFQVAAQVGAPPEYVEFQRQRGSFLPPPGTSLDQLLKTNSVVHRGDDLAEPVPSAPTRLAGAKSHLAVPMFKDEALIGAITIYRQEVRPFTDKQIALVQNFAAQAVIAIENTRLLNELRQSLEQQTATAEVLGVISSSPGELEPVFQAMLENATRLCEAKFGVLLLHEDGSFRQVAIHNAPAACAELRQRQPVARPSPLTPQGRVAATKQVLHIPDFMEDVAYKQRDPLTVWFVEATGARTLVVVPMLKEDELVGVIAIFRQEVRPFTDKQIALVTSFAAQAVIAIENTRLLNELRQSLQQQTATADVLKIISRSTFDLKTVLNTLVESAARLCEADMASVPRVTGGIFDQVASYGYSPGFHEFLRDNPTSPGRGTVSGRAVLEGRTVHIPDVLADPEYDYGEGQKIGGYRTLLGVPLMREGAAVGALLLGRSAPRPFTPQQIELVETFADQAVIAIENVRLFDEIQDKSRQLEEASQHKSQFLANMSHELRTPLNAILGYTELMADGAYGEPSEKMLGILKRLESNGKHLLGLINDVLDLSKIEAGQLVLELSDYSVQDIAQTVRSTLEPLAADKKLAFKLELAPELPAGHGDGRRLTQVLINLVGNAIKFTDAGEVAIKAEAKDGAFYVSVRDTGPGISAADQTKLFQEFQQADNAITRKKGGTGLGLAISKRIIEMHGGKIWVESQPGQGSTFAFTFPVIVERQVEPV